MTLLSSVEKFSVEEKFSSPIFLLNPNRKYLTPVLADIDGDNDYDLIAGTETSGIAYQENIGTEDEENNYYSLGGDNHNDLEEDKGE